MGDTVPLDDLIPAGGSRQRSATGLGHDVVPEEDWYLEMEGRMLFRHAVERMTQSARAAIGDRPGRRPGRRTSA